MANELLCKATYPLLGNLSSGVKEEVENFLGSENFSARNATEASYWTNAVIYAGLGVHLGMGTDISGMGAVCGGLAGAMLATLEGFCREASYNHDIQTWGLSETGGKTASLVGKVVSLPLDAIMILNEKIKENKRGK
ncbi:hypothetical protein HZA97_10090 [Candidatus Woesearchaeota archaeon]|nr:hypothetical protein [Candidatus Woesearchaeota archaeon]